MATTTAVSGNAYKNNGATVVKGGNVPSTSTVVTNVQTLRENATSVPKKDTKPFLAVSPTSSGNVGTVKPLSGGTFGYDPPTNISSSTAVSVIAKRVSTTISGASNTILKFGAADKALHRAVRSSVGNRSLGRNSWNAVTGAITKGATAGTLVQQSGIDGTVGRLADDTIAKSTFAIPGELVYMITGKTPTQADYAAKYSP